MSYLKRARELIKWLCPHGIMDIRRRRRLALECELYNTKGFEAKSYLLNLDRDNQSPETAKAADYLKTCDRAVVPYEFKRKYCPEDTAVFYDTSCRLCFVLHKGRRMYFPRRYSIADVQLYYNSVRCEQDEESPHRYIEETSGGGGVAQGFDEFTVKEGDVLADIGAGEGIWALEYAEKAGKLYLFECEYEWVLPLRKTFEPWKDKTVIVNKFVSDTEGRNRVTLDGFFKGKRLDFIKADIEGAEREMLKGAKEILTDSRSLKLAICAYHREDDEELLTKTLESAGFTCYPYGHVIPLGDEDLKAPYLRRCLIRAKK